MSRYETMSSEPCESCCGESVFEPIPEVIDKANACLYEAVSNLARVYKLVFGDEVKANEIPKCACLEQSVAAVAARADEILKATESFARRLGA